MPRSLPTLKFGADAPKVVWDMPASARERFVPLALGGAPDDASLNIFGEIGANWDGTGVTDKYVAAFLRRTEAKDITINLNSPGGDFFTGVAVYNMLREHKGTVTVNVLSLAASAASIIAMAADEVRIAKSAFMMIHKTWGLVVGNELVMSSVADLFRQFDRSSAEVYAARSALDVKAVEKLMAANNGDGTFFSGQEAVDNGFADGFTEADVTPTEDDAPTNKARNALDLILAKAGISRTERRALLSEAVGKPGAAHNNAMPGAGDVETAHALAGLLTSITQAKEQTP